MNGVLSAVGFSLFGLKYWPILAVVAAVMSIIPIFGSHPQQRAGGGHRAHPVAGDGGRRLAWILGIHQLEANFLNPKIIGDTAKIHPVLVVFSLIVGEHFFQLAGALFAVPCHVHRADPLPPLPRVDHGRALLPPRRTGARLSRTRHPGDPGAGDPGAPRSPSRAQPPSAGGDEKPASASG